MNIRCRIAAALLLSTTAASAQDRADIDRTQIIGNRELPKVLYIVPWKKPLPGQLSGRPVHSVLDEALAPVDREVFKRQADYSAQLRARSTTVAAVAAAPAAALTAAPANSPAISPAPLPAPLPAVLPVIPPALSPALSSVPTPASAGAPR